jgi:hypothetical protein
MKLRILPLLLAVVGSSVLLFGGWFMYRSYAMESPLTKLVGHVQGVNNVTTNFNNNEVTIDVKLGNNASLRDLYSKIQLEGASIIGGRDVKLQPDSQTSDEIEKWWGTSLFQVAQAMETRHYAEIPAYLQQHAAELSGLKVATEMDEKNVYIRLSKGENSKYVILPRQAAVMGAWSSQ